MRARALLCIALAMLVAPATASAHVELTPGTLAPGTNGLITVMSPNESDQALTGLRLTIPPELTIAGVVPAPGFTTDVVEDQSGRVATISWQGGSIDPGLLALFQFSATAPDQERTITLTALQTFADGSQKLWEDTAVLDVAPDSGSSGSDTLARVLGGIGIAFSVAAGLGLLLVLRTRRTA
jgi:periplasmic copper chaperone A